MVAFGGWEMPLEYPTGTIREHMACRRQCAVFDVSHLGTVRLQGERAVGRLQHALTNDLGRIAPGKAQYTHLLDEDGSVLDDLIVWWVEDERFDVVANASNTSKVLEALGGTDVTAERAVVAVQGPGARAFLGEVFPEAALVGRFRVRTVDWRGVAITVAGTGYTGEDGVECAIPAAQASAFWEALTGTHQARGRRADALGGPAPPDLPAAAVPAGLGARDTLRLEAGLPLHGHELGPGITPLEAGLGWVVAWDKPGGFRGRDALARQQEAGAPRSLKGVVGEGRQPLRSGFPVFAGGEVVAELTSGNFSPMLGRGIGMCFLPVELDLPPGSAVEVDGRGRRLAGRTARLPFVAGHRASGREA